MCACSRSMPDRLIVSVPWTKSPNGVFAVGFRCRIEQEGVGAGSAPEGVTTAIAVDGVAAGRAVQRVVRVAADDGLPCGRGRRRGADVVRLGSLRRIRRAEILRHEHDLVAVDRAFLEPDPDLFSEPLTMFA